MATLGPARFARSTASQDEGYNYPIQRSALGPIADLFSEMIRDVPFACILVFGCATQQPTVPISSETSAKLGENLRSSALWSAVEIRERPSLTIDLRLAQGQSQQEACDAALQTVSGILPPETPRKVRLIREWRVLRDC
jgi:hypothetical protein